MKLLFDQNISFRILGLVANNYPLSIQVRVAGLENKSDLEIWQFAKANAFTIVTFDSDFYDITLLKGHPPKIIWLRSGNTNTKNLAAILIRKKDTIAEFITSEKFKNLGCLELG